MKLEKILGCLNQIEKADCLMLPEYASHLNAKAFIGMLI